MVFSSFIVHWMQTFQFLHGVSGLFFSEVDDGFWVGEFNGRTGVFPSLVVELIHVEAEEKDQEVRLHGSVRGSNSTTTGLLLCGAF